MRPRTFSVLFLLVAIFLVVSFATDVFVDEHVRPRTAFAALVASTVLGGAASLALNIDLPE